MGFSSLEIGKRALIAQKFGLDITGNNIANVNTPGYSRRAAILTETEQIRQKGNHLGTGVVVQKIQNFREEYYDKEIRNALSRVSNYENDTTYLQRLETILAEPGDTGINEIVTNFFNKFEELTVKPESIALRQNLMNISTTLTDRINYSANSIADLRQEVKKKSSAVADNINSLLIDVASLNNQILRSGNNSTPTGTERPSRSREASGPTENGDGLGPRGESGSGRGEKPRAPQRRASGRPGAASGGTSGVERRGGTPTVSPGRQHQLVARPVGVIGAMTRATGSA